MGMDLLLAVTELPDPSVTIDEVNVKIADAIQGMSDFDRNWLREAVAYDADDDELVEVVQRYFRCYRDGHYERNCQDWQTFDESGAERTVIIFGCESWGDVPEAYDAGTAFALLPEGWWK